MLSNPQIAIEQLPQAEHVTFEPMSDSSPIEHLISWSITFFLLGIVFVTVWFLTSPPNVVAFSALGGYFALLSWVVFYIFASHKKRGIAVREHDIMYINGLIWRSTTIIPFNRIQHIEVVRGPVERFLDLSSLKIFSAGGLSSDLSISGLTSQRAEAIKQLILDKAEGQVSDEIDSDNSQPIAPDAHSND